MSRVFWGAISSQLTCGKKPIFLGANCPIVVLELHRSSPLGLKTPLLQPQRKGAPERSSSGVLEACWRKFLSEKSCSFEKSWAKANTAGRDF
jgi:hypothetical protein